MTVPPSLPAWLQQLAEAAPGLTGEQLSRHLPPDHGGRESAILVLFGDGPYGPDVLLIERAATLRSHAGQPAFPGGALDPGDASPAAAALREAVEETGLDPHGVEILAELPSLWLPPSGFVVAPVLAWWREPSVVGPVDPAECAAVARIPIADLVDPANRLRVRHPAGYVGPAFEVGGMLVWGFTAGLLDRLLELAGWALPWDATRLRDLPA
ncbi:CoA pyrophosphatase [Acidothermaceae bacterium B102]|nr:CoA pyrophosphatase [Acidothermaceae bacterium B102]